MKTKKLISTALAVILLFTAIVAAFPVAASAAYVKDSSTTSSNIVELQGDDLKNYINDVYLKYKFNSAAEMLEYEKNYKKDGKDGEGLLKSASFGDRYNIYINVYTGLMYYVDNYTGQILTSNPTDPGKIVSESARREFMSQLVFSFVESSNSTAGYEYNSIQWAALYNQITVTEIADGLRVNYTLGDTTTRFLLPGRITADRFEEYILIPMIETFEELFFELCPEDAYKFEEYDGCVAREAGYINTGKGGLRTYLDDAVKTASELLEKDDPNKKALQTIASDIKTLLTRYSLKNPAIYADDDSQRAQDILADWAKNFPITKDGVAIYVYDAETITTTKRQHSNLIKKYCFDYTMSMMFEDEEYCGYVDNSVQKPVFRCAIEYTFNEDGTLSVRLPANSITFDESVYTLKGLTPLKYFGAGSIDKDGNLFFPDGSGTVVEFSDFYSEGTTSNALLVTASVFGSDYCYSKITGAHRAQLTMPVYGINYTETASEQIKAATGKDTVKSGYFAILEEGASLANLAFSSGGAVHKYISVYASYNPYPSDEYDLSQTISVGSLGTYSIVADSKYSGSYVTKIVMLNEASVGNAILGAGKYYESTYSGMAAYYRDYLTKDGTLSAIKTAANDLPLYIEVLGSMTIMDKFLTFPVEKSIPLTTFEDIQSIYAQLSDSESYLKALVDSYTATLAEEQAKPKNEQDEIVLSDCKRMIEKYTALIGKVDAIKNVNFRLTGFANGGMYYTYPTKIKWERACGGKSDFKDLVAASAAISAQDGYNFGIYPDFDFMYINNTASFDGISYKDTSAKMVDNRYASKQVYNSVLGEYESFFAMLISSDMLDELYTKFLKKYSKYDLKTISVATLGSDLNSNFDEDNSINRDQSRENLTSLLKRMTEEDGYTLMTDVGNIYSVKYTSHILNVATDSSHLRYSSYTIPFLGMILHGSVSYAGSPFNYSGAVDYDVLRSIENGAAPYYILCYQNSSHMKDDEMLSKYYGIDYVNWYDKILSTYTNLNQAIGSLQDYVIVDHQTLITERVIDADETATNYKNLQNEIVDMLDEQIAAKVAEAYKSIRDDYATNGDKLVHVTVDVEALMAKFAEYLGVELNTLKLNADNTETDFYKQVKAIAADYEARYEGAEDATKNIEIAVSDIDYDTQYEYFTTSTAFDEDYVYTDYTLDDNKVVMVTYQKGDSVVRFILNYNMYSVQVRLEDGSVKTLAKYAFIKL